MSVKGIITNISRASVHDGPGIRTVVYFKGCGLRCRWCHNPETQSAANEIIYSPVKCIRCGRCIEVCPKHHRVKNGAMEFLRAGCSGCGRCAEACPSGALSSAGREETAENVVKEVLKDRRFFEESGGGVTLSGGECLLQPDFAAEILKRCAEENVHTAVETALFTDFGAVEKTLPFCRLYLADLKIPDPEKHKRYTGQDNRRIVANLRSLAERAPGKVLVRIPLIPGVNDTDIPGFAELLSPLAGALRGAEVLRYNSLAGSKYEVCGREYRDFGESQTGEEMALFCSRLQDALGGGMPVFTSV